VSNFPNSRAFFGFNLFQLSPFLACPIRPIFPTWAADNQRAATTLYDVVSLFFLCYRPKSERLKLDLFFKK
jgi:hypothetical protein